MSGKILLQDPAFNSFGYVLRCRIAGSFGSSVYKFLRYFHIIAHSGCTLFYNPTISSWRFQFLHILINTSYFLFSLILAILMGLKWYIIVVLICISLMISNIDHLFICSCPFFIFGKMSIHILSPFKKSGYFYWVMKMKAAYCVWLFATPWTM